MAEARSQVRVLDPTDLWIHGAVALGVTLALASAPLLQAPSLAETLGAGALAPVWLHASGATLAALAWLLHGARVCLGWLAGENPWGLAPTSGDLRDLGRALRWGAGLAPSPPPGGRYSYRERLPYAAFAIALPVLALTGGAVAHPGASVGLLGGSGLVTVASVHFALGALLVPFLLWHLYFALLQPGALPWNSAWLTGKVPWERLARTRPGWAAEILAAEAPAPPEDESIPVSVESLLTDGNQAAREGRYADAEAAYLRALELYPGYSQALFNLGVARWKAGDGAGAEEVLSRFLEQDPFNPMAPKARQILAESRTGGPDV